MPQSCMSIVSAVLPAKYTVRPFSKWIMNPMAGPPFSLSTVPDPCTAATLRIGQAVKLEPVTGVAPVHLCLGHLAGLEVDGPHLEGGHDLRPGLDRDLVRGADLVAMAVGHEDDVDLREVRPP